MKHEEIRPFREGLFHLTPNGSGYLIASRCQRCAVTYFPRREFCIKCLENTQIEDIRLSRRGILHTFTVVHRSTPQFETPYIVGYIDLPQDGVRIFSPLIDRKPEELQVGMEMVLVFGPVNKKRRDESDRRQFTYQFKPLSAPGGV